MGLRETDRVDIIARGADGGAILVISDAGLVDDPQERLRLFHAKLATCVAYARGGAFAGQFPPATTPGVKILVRCASPPTGEMQKVEAVRSPRGGEMIEVEFQYTPLPDWLRDLAT